MASKVANWCSTLYLIVVFSNTALVGAVLKLSRGEPATVGDGIRIALSHLARIVVYALISATIGLLAQNVAVGIAMAIPALVVLAVVVALALIGAVALLSGAVNGVFQASLYRYATTGDAGPFISTGDAASAFGSDRPAVPS